MDNYKLSEAAAADLENLYLYGITNYGLRQADLYYEDLVERFEMLFEHPDWGSDYTFIAAKLFRYEYGSHSIYYQHRGDKVLIVRVLGKWQDPGRHIVHV